MNLGAASRKRAYVPIGTTLACCCRSVKRPGTIYKPAFDRMADSTGNVDGDRWGSTLLRAAERSRALPGARERTVLVLPLLEPGRGAGLGRRSSARQREHYCRKGEAGNSRSGFHHSPPPAAMDGWGVWCWTAIDRKYVSNWETRLAEPCRSPVSLVLPNALCPGRTGDMTRNGVTSGSGTRRPNSRASSLSEMRLTSTRNSRSRRMKERTSAVSVSTAKTMTWTREPWVWRIRLMFGAAVTQDARSFARSTHSTRASAFTSADA